MPIDQRSDATHLRKEAERVRLKAAAASNSMIGQELLGMALQYEQLALATENREKETHDPSLRPTDDGNPIATRELYSSPNGGRWLLARDAGGRVFVKHEANMPSGGKVTEYGVGASARKIPNREPFLT